MRSLRACKVVWLAIICWQLAILHPHQEKKHFRTKLAHIVAIRKTKTAQIKISPKEIRLTDKVYLIICVAQWNSTKKKMLIVSRTYTLPFCTQDIKRIKSNKSWQFFKSKWVLFGIKHYGIEYIQYRKHEKTWACFRDTGLELWNLRDS